MQMLDDVASKYLQATDLGNENNFIRNWYPRRMALRTGPVNLCPELGLGPGYAIRHVQDLAEEHTIIEGSSRVIERVLVSNLWFSVEIVEGCFGTFEPKGRFDLIVMGGLLEHFEDPVAGMDLYRHFLTPAGRLFVAVPNAKSLNRRLGVDMAKISGIHTVTATVYKLGNLGAFCREALGADAHAADLQVGYEEEVCSKPLPLCVLQNLDEMDATLDVMLTVGADHPDLCVALLFELVQKKHD